MRVYTSDGQYAGTVYGVGEDRFQIEKGLVPPHDFLIDFSAIRWMSDKEIELRLTQDQLVEYRPDVGGALPPKAGDETGEPLHSTGWD